MRVQDFWPMAAEENTTRQEKTAMPKIFFMMILSKAKRLEAAS
jgi:hypothetical protein